MVTDALPQICQAAKNNHYGRVLWLQRLRNLSEKRYVLASLPPTAFAASSASARLGL